METKRVFLIVLELDMHGTQINSMMKGAILWGQSGAPGIITHQIWNGLDCFI